MGFAQGTLYLSVRGSPYVVSSSTCWLMHHLNGEVNGTLTGAGG